ncbi:MAG: extracellular solute-binding protein [Paenibacillaceae bacterium]
MSLIKNKWLTFGLAIVLCLMAVAGCTNNGSQPPSETPDTTTPDTTAPDSTVDAPLEPTPIQMMVMTLQDPPSMSNEYYTELQKMTNTKLDIIWVPDADYNTRFDLVMASGDIPEVVVQGDYQRPTLVQGINNGAFWDLTEFLGDFSKYPNLKNNSTPGSWKYATYNGKVMGIPRSRGFIDLGIFMRKDWLEELNIPVPKTVDEFTDALRKIVAAKPGVIGTLDQPITNGDSMWASFGVFEPTYNSEGGMIRDFLTPQYEELVEWFKMIYAEGLMPQEFTALNTPARLDLLQTGRAAAYQQSSYRTIGSTAILKKTDPKGELMVIPPLVGPKGHIGATLDAGTRGAFYISSKVPKEKVPDILAYFEKTISEEVTYLSYHGKEGVHHTLVDGEPVLNDLGKEQIQVTALNPVAPAFSKWAKVHAPSGTKEQNKAKEIEMAPFEEHGKVSPFRWVVSNTWNDTWPEYDATFQSNVVKTVIGQMSMEDLKKYLEGLRNDPKLKQAFKEYAEDYKARN